MMEEHLRMLQDSTETDEPPVPVVVAWTGIWVTLLVSAAQGLLFYLFFLHQRSRDRARFQADNPNHSSCVDVATAKRAFDLYESRQHTRAYRSPPPFEEMPWWKAAWDVSNVELLRCVGLDAYMFLRVLRLGARICGFGSILSLVLLPVYATGNQQGPDKEQFNLLTLVRVESGSSWRLYVTVAVWFLFCAGVLHEFWTEWLSYAQHRANFLARGDMDMPHAARYTIRVEQMTPHRNSDRAVQRYFERLFPGKVFQTASALHIAQLEGLIAARKSYILKLEAVTARQHAKQDKKMAQIKVDGERVDVDVRFRSEIARLNREIDIVRGELVTVMGLLDSQKQQPSPSSSSKTTTAPPSSTFQGNGNDDSIEVDVAAAMPSAAGQSPSSSNQTRRLVVEDDPNYPQNDDDDVATSGTTNPARTSTAFVTFASLRAKQAALQCALTDNPDKMVVFPAFDPAAMLWPNVTVPLPRQVVLQKISAIFFTAGILFWAVPVTFVVSVSNLNSILESVGLNQADANALWYGIVAGLLPVVALAILMIVLYKVIAASAVSFIRIKSWPEVDAHCLFWHMLFQFANLWLIVLGGSLFGNLDQILDNPSWEDLVESIANAMPAQSVFFVNMIVVSSFGAFGLELSMLPKHVVSYITGCISPEAARTQRQLDSGQKPPSIVWGQIVPPAVFIFLVSFLYSKCTTQMTDRKTNISQSFRSTPICAVSLSFIASNCYCLLILL